MNLPSLSYIYRKASKTIRRFPFALLASVISAFCAVWLIDLGYSERDSYEFLYKIIMVSTLGIPWFTVIVLTVEKWEKNKLWSWGGQLVGLGLLTIYYISLPDSLFDGLEKHGIRYALFFLGVHLLVAIAPFWKKGEINGFWQYNKTLFLRFLTAILYSHVLYVGLIVAMLSIDHLFGVELPGKWYGQLWVLILGIFNTWFFLSGIPRNLSQLESHRDYPKGLKVFTQYILIPLVIVYLVILYLYAGKIIMEWQWPEGWVAILTLSFSVAGIFSLLLLFPIQEKVENRWIKSFSRYYYISLIPLVILLLLAIWRRISEYGFTENRYFVLILGFWLAGIVVYFIFNRIKSIKVIPGSLCIITFLVSFGPWGAFSISENSQINRLESLLTKNKILEDGQIQKTSHTVPKEDIIQISAAVRYLSDVHGLEGIQPWFEQDLTDLATVTVDSVEQINRASQSRKVVELMGLQYTDAWNSEVSLRRTFTTNNKGAYPLEEYEWMIKSRNFYSGRDTSTVYVDTLPLFVQLNTDSLWLAISNKKSNISELKIDLKAKIDELDQSFDTQQGYNIPMGKMSLEKENEWVKVRLNLNNMTVRREYDRWVIQSIQTDMFMSLKRQK